MDQNRSDSGLGRLASVSAVTPLFHPHPKCAHVTLRHQRLTPRLCVQREEAHTPTHTH